MRQLLHSPLAGITAFLCNMFMAYVVYAICRVVFIALNWDTFGPAFSHLDLGLLLTGCWFVASSAIFDTLAIYVLLMLFPCHLRENGRYQSWVKVVYLVIMAIAIIANFCDAVYYPFTGRRTTLSVFSEFANDDNVGGIIWIEVLRHWYLVLLAIGMIWGMYKLYVKPRLSVRDGKKAYYITNVVVFLFMVWATVVAMRGGATGVTRPITMSNANQYVNHPGEAAMLLNTPFTMIRASNHKSFVDPAYYNKEELDQRFSPIVEPQPADTIGFREKNVVVFILESFGREYIGAFNDTLEGGSYKGYTPFLDELIAQSLTFDYSFANGRKSIDAMPSILSSIPMFVEPYFVSSTSLNEVGGLADCLNPKGYRTLFVHGADNGSMGFEAFAHATQFKQYLGRDEYSDSDDPEFDGDRDFDGRWAIWDQPFMRYWLKQLNAIGDQPFLSAIFTATSHHPFHIPESFKDIYPEEELPIHKCVRYVDNALREFFTEASKQPWYENTIFVLTGDHTNMTNHDMYQTDLGLYCSPVIFFDPSGEMPRGRRHAVAQQIDIMPTVLGWLHYDKPYLAFGQDLINTPDSLTYAVSYNNGIYQMVKNGYMLQFDGKQSTALYDIQHDWMLHDNLLRQEGHTEADSIRQDYEQWFKALIQSYMQRMVNDQLVCNPKKVLREK
ncbi:MAG: LTA synthase family protein [Prevotellaceae bacterium]|nr:LTA synthase family protein [Candidatus Minthosoma caballi]